MLALWASRGTIGGMLVIASKSFIDSIERDDEAVVKTWEDVLRERKAAFKGHDEVVCFGGACGYQRHAPGTRIRPGCTHPLSPWLDAGKKSMSGLPPPLEGL